MSIDTTWRSRIVATGDESPEQLRANPANWRRHPDAQRAVLGEMLDQVGWVAQVIVNRTTGNLVDGHLRVEMAVERSEPTVPVSYVELTDEEERLVLAALDPIAGLALTDDAALAALVDGLEVGGALEQLLAELSPPAGPDEPDRTAEHLEALTVSLGTPRHEVERDQVWHVAHHHLVIASVYDGWPTYLPLLEPGRLLVPYPTPIVPLTERAKTVELVMVQPDVWLAGHLLDKYTEVNGEDSVWRAE
jgi:hypothetical protein